MSALDLIVRGGRLAGGAEADVGVRDGVIVAVAPGLEGSARDELDARGLLVLPGTVDVHVHLNDPGRTAWEGIAVGTRALGAGGTTSACDMPLNAIPPTVDAAAFDAKAAIVEREAHVDVGLWGGIVPGRLDALDVLAERGVVGFKAFMSDSGVPEFARADDDTLLEGMRRAARLGLPVAVHAEDQAIVGRRTAAARARGAVTLADFAAARPVEAELVAVQRAVALAGEAGCALHVVHVSSVAAVTHLLAARRRGADVTFEATAHHLLLDDHAAERIGALAKCAPPLRPAIELDGLWAAIGSGDLDVIASDHSPSPPELRDEDDAFASWGGIGAGQLLTALVLDEAARRGLDLATVDAALTGRPAARFALHGKGALVPGGDADLLLVDAGHPWTVRAAEVHHRHPRTPFEGSELRVRIRRTLLRGETVAIDGAPVGPPRGRLLLGPRTAQKTGDSV